MKKNALYRASEHYVHRRVAGNDVLISVGAGVANFNGYITLNASAAFLWEKLQEPVTSDALICAMLDEFEVTEEQARRDVLEFLWYLQNHSMVSVTEYEQT